MTQKLFYDDAFCRIFTATVVSCTEKAPEKKGKQKEPVYEVVLDRTAFYPEGGGQPGDRGLLRILGGAVETPNALRTQERAAEDAAGSAAGSAAENAAQNAAGSAVRVLDTHERGGEVIHLTDRPLEPGVQVEGELDWEFRFDQMQNHTGEHIVSGLIHEKYGYENVGFHMGSDFITIDLNGEIDEEGLKEIEARANRVIWADVPVEIAVYDEEDVKALTYRSKKELHGEVRIVTIPGADVCACCGMHVAHTGQIGLVRLFSCEKFRSGVRIELLCGRRALTYLNEIWAQNREISHLLSARPLQTAAAVNRLKEQERTAAEKLYGLELAGISRTAEEMRGRGNVALFVKDDLQPDQIRRLADAVMNTCGGLCCTFAGNDSEGYKYALGEADADLRTFVKEMNAALSGRGGGKPHFAQGGVSASRQEITDFLCKSRDAWYIKEV